jgi:hypothetical protein
MLDSGELSLTPVNISLADAGFDKVRFAPLCPENAVVEGEPVSCCAKTEMPPSPKTLNAASSAATVFMVSSLFDGE